jgi:DNA polymerase
VSPSSPDVPDVPDSRSIATLARAAAGCTACPLYRDAIQTVFGKGDRRAAILLVGEQPGDVEDKKGLPFVGPAGAVLWSCVEDAGIDRDSVFATNAVKHFKHELRGKRRLHKKPNTDEIEACHPWLEAEVAAVRPRVIVALGAVAARSLLGRPVPIEASRGTPLEVHGVPLHVTYHPSAVLRGQERAGEIRAALVDDLASAADAAAHAG